MIKTVHQLSYQDAWLFLDRLQFFKIKLGLEAMTTFMGELNNPHTKFPCIHIGGTNGKGSVGATLLSILTEAGYRVGFYTSPHLSSVRERFRINDTFISEDEFAGLAKRIIDILDGRQITYFEFTTSMAMLWFAEKEVDLAILEVGLGGRLDATNIVTPLVSVITNVSMDHEEHLGDTISQVAAEKAGIIKPGIPLITGISDKKAIEVILDKAEGLASPIHILGQDFSGAYFNDNNKKWSYNGIQSLHENRPPVYSELPLNMKGAYQVDNASLALAALEIINPLFPVNLDQISNGLKRVNWPGRLEEFWRTSSGRISYEPPDGNKPACHFLLDGAHNPAGALALKASLHKEVVYDKIILVWASMADKDIQSTLMEIAPLAHRIIFTKPDEERSAKPKQLTELLPENLRLRTDCIDSVELALDHAVEKCTPGALICVAGSLYLVGKARQILCGELVNA